MCQDLKLSGTNLCLVPHRWEVLLSHEGPPYPRPAPLNCGFPICHLMWVSPRESSLFPQWSHCTATWVRLPFLITRAIHTHYRSFWKYRKNTEKKVTVHSTYDSRLCLVSEPHYLYALFYVRPSRPWVHGASDLTCAVVFMSGTIHDVGVT